MGDLRRWHRRIFAASWLSYFSYYFTRKPFSATKTALQAQFGLSKGQLNYIDTGYNALYCIGMFVNGAVIDSVGPRRWVSIGMLTSAVLAVVFAGVSSVTGSVLGIYMLVWGINGLAQSSGWPGNSKVMAAWWSTEERGPVMGFWSTCYNAGGLVATLVCARLLATFGWRGAFLGPAIWVAVVGVAFYALVRDRPSDVGFPDPDTVAVNREERVAAMRAARREILRNPMVWAMGGAYFACKVIRYALLFWLPYYLEKALAYDAVQSNELSTAFEAGGVVLVVVAGYVADRVLGKRRVLTAFLSMLGLVGALFLYRAVGDTGTLPNICALMLVGGFLFAADSLISGAVAQDMSGPHAAALAAGVVNGVGSIGQVFQGFLLVYVSDKYGWPTLFNIFAGLAFLGSLMCIPYLRVRPRGVPDLPRAAVR
ncbi:MAG TPA: MFS transporter [Kofleriaceae bacterium]